MHLPLSRAVAGQLDVLPQIGSTNAELVARASAGEAIDFAVLVTDDQTAGRGRLGRVWFAPAGKTLAASVFLDTGSVSPERLSWVPLLAGLAMTRAVSQLVPTGLVSLKWPNDVLVDSLKVAGILTELVPRLGVVVGAGLNLTLTAAELPTPTSTSLTLNGVAADSIMDTALSAYLVELRALSAAYLAADCDARVAGLHAAVSRACGTMGQRVRVDMPGGDELWGLATGLDDCGRLILQGSSVADHRVIAAGDVTHLRHA
ncbi:MAG: biotin--[acetyl-CoA-carboxylase] ligase [Rhodoglobus sp.]